MAVAKASGEAGLTTKPVSLCLLMNEVPVPISQVLIGFPHIAASTSTMP